LGYPIAVFTLVSYQVYVQLVLVSLDEIEGLNED